MHSVNNFFPQSQYFKYVTGHDHQRWRVDIRPFFSLTLKSEHVCCLLYLFLLPQSMLWFFNLAITSD